MEYARRAARGILIGADGGQTAWLETWGRDGHRVGVVA
jgi:hypothetical protein